MASLPPVRTREEAEQDAEFIHGCLMEAGRPDLAAKTTTCTAQIGPEIGWQAHGVGHWSTVDALLFHRAARLLFPDYACGECWERTGYVTCADAEQILRDCDHVLVAPRGVA